MTVPWLFLFGNGEKCDPMVTYSIVSIQILNYVASNSILTPTQFTYRPVYSTERAALDVGSHIVSHSDGGQVTSVGW